MPLCAGVALFYQFDLYESGLGSMSPFDIALGSLIFLMGVLFAVFAERLVSAWNWGSKRMRYMSAAGGMVVGVGLGFAVDLSNSTDVIRVVAIGVFIAGLIYLVMPQTVWERIIRWLTIEHLVLYRAVAVAYTTLLGGYIIIAGIA